MTCKLLQIRFRLDGCLAASALLVPRLLLESIHPLDQVCSTRPSQPISLHHVLPCYFAVFLMFAVPQTETSNQPSTGPNASQEQQPELIRAIAMADPERTNQIVRSIQSGEQPSDVYKSANLEPPQRFLIHRDSSSGIEANFSRQDHTFGMVKGADVRETHATPGAEEFHISTFGKPWTSVTHDADLLEHLLDLYFTWQHSFFQNFPEVLFRSDMKAGRTKYCSSMLVNAICANGAYLSSRPAVNQDQGNGKTMLDLFFEEALHNLNHSERPSITTTASLYLISYVAGTKVSHYTRQLDLMLPLGSDKY